MEKIITAKTVEEAKATAAKAFGVPESALTFEVLEEPKIGLFGLFAKGEAKVRATYTPVSDQEIVPPPVEYHVSEDDLADQAAEAAAAAADAAEETAEETAEAVEEAAAETVEAAEEAAAADDAPIIEEVAEDEAPAAVEPVPDVIEAVAVVADAPAEPEAPAATEAPAEKTAEEKPARTPLQQDEDLITGEPSEAALEKIERAKSYLDSILKQLGVEAEFVVTAGAESAMIEIVAANNGTVIGKRGETLDALQYLTFMIANRGDKDYYRIILNSANYRERRRKTLEELAAKIARNVQRSGRQTTLEPMNPYERRIIHSAIAEIEGVSSRSIGEEPYRKVVISSTTRPQRAGGRRGERSDRNDRGDRRGRDRGRRGNDRRDRRRSDAPPQRMSMDSMKTSFERDYKRPKEDDDINTGLYGKIEF